MQRLADKKQPGFILLLLLHWQLHLSQPQCLELETLPTPTVLQSVKAKDLMHVNCSNTNLQVEQSVLTKLYNNSFRSLGDLRALSLRKDYIKDIEIEAFWPMTKLLVLDLGENELSNLAATSFRPLQELQHLYIDNNQLVSLNYITYLTKLQLLDASGNQLSNSLTRFPALPELVILRIKNANLKYFTNDVFSQLDKICELDLTNNRLNIINLRMALQSVNVESIQILRLGNDCEPTSNQKGEGMNHYAHVPGNCFPKLPNLHTLDLSQTEIQGFEPNLAELFPKLNVLVLRSNWFGDIPDWIVNASIEHLDLSNNYIRILKTERNLPFLKHLDLSRNMFKNWESSNTLSGFPNLRTLNLSYNAMKSMESHSFMNLNNLETLDISNNKLDVIVNDTFRGLQSLRHLYIEHNSLWILRDNRPFENLFNLTVLTFHHNSLCEIWPWVFPDQINLEELDFSYNKIELWDESVFHNTKKLRVLNLQKNDLKAFTPTMLKELSEKHFEMVDLSQNEFDCTDCRINNLIDWLKIKTNNCNEMNKLDTTESIPCIEYHTVTCLDREKKTISVDYETMPYIECTVSGDAKSPVKYLCGALAAVLGMVFVASVLYCWRWHVKYYMYKMFGCQCSRARRYSDEDYEYNAYISYCEADRLWLQNIFLPRFENRDTNLHFYVLERDFEPGRYMIENIMEGLEKSRCFVVLLSQEYLRNSWRNWEFNWAACRLASQGGSGGTPMVILNLGRVSERDMSPTMRSVAQTQLHYKWSHEGPRQRLIWEKLGQALTRHQVNNNNSGEEENQNTRF